MKKLLAVLISLCMVSAFAVPVFADANSDYIAAVKAYQAQIAAKEAAYVAAVDAYSKNAKAKADADSAAILKAARAAQAKADAECLAVIAAGKAAQAQADARVAAVIAAGKAAQASADQREAAYAKAVKAYQDQIAAREAAYIKAVLGKYHRIPIIKEERPRRALLFLVYCVCGGRACPARSCKVNRRLPEGCGPHMCGPRISTRLQGQAYCSFASVASASSRMRSNFSRAASTGAGVARSTPAWRSSSSG